MATCYKCGVDNVEAAQFCGVCGNTLSREGQQQPGYYLFHNASRQTYGPLQDVTVREWISQKRVTPSDLVCRGEGQDWVPLLQSEFGRHIADQMSLERLAATTCPRCGSAMVGVVKGSGAGLALIIIGILLTPIFIGIPIWIIGMSMRHGSRAQTYFSCPRCNFATG